MGARRGARAHGTVSVVASRMDATPLVTLSFTDAAGAAHRVVLRWDLSAAPEFSDPDLCVAIVARINAR